MLDDDNLILPDRRPPRADALKNRALLLDTAARLFAEHGVESTTMSAIADAAGVGKGTLYRHFDDKVDLCIALLDHDQRDLQDRTLRRLRSGSDPVADLDWFLEQVVRFVARNLDLIDVAGGGTVSLDLRAHGWWRQTIRGLLARIGVVEPDALDYFADVLFVMVDARSLRYLLHGQDYTLDRVIDNLLLTVRHLTR